jgi:hypothetical protein
MSGLCQNSFTDVNYFIAHNLLLNKKAVRQSCIPDSTELDHFCCITFIPAYNCLDHNQFTKHSRSIIKSDKSLKMNR